MKKIDLKTYTKPSDFVKFPVGETKVILVSEGGIFKKHGMKTATSYIPLGNCTEKSDCKFCLKGNEPKIKWMWVAYVNNEVKVLDVGPMIGDGICQESQKHGLSNFNNSMFSIKRTGTKVDTKYEVKYLGQNSEKLDTENAKNLLVKKYFI